MRKIYLFAAYIFSVFFLFLISCQKPQPSLDDTIVLSENWYIINSTQINIIPEKINAEMLLQQGGYKATVPTTVLAALVKNGVYKNPYFGKNLLKIPKDRFKSSWWFVKEFNLKDELVTKNALLKFDGINYRANIWLNGKQIAAADTTFGSFRVFGFDVSGKLRAGKNILSVEIFPPKAGDFTIGFVDWNPWPPDNNMGIWRPVSLCFSGAVSMQNTFVYSDLNTETLKEAAIYISTWLQNHTNKKIRMVLRGEIEGKVFEYPLALAPFEKKNISLSPKEISLLKIQNPRLWWPNNLGSPALYNLKLKVMVNGRESARENITFGIRKIEDYFTEEGYRGYKINGRPILIKGGGWVDDLLLNDTPEKVEAQVKYTKQMNLNTIRLEGFWGKDKTLYDLCDRYGILVMVGWSCHWEWEEYVGKACDEFGGIKTDEEVALISKSWQDQITLFRNHPSVFVWMGGSDKLPRPKLEKEYLKILKNEDPTRPYLASAGGFKSRVSGPTGVKMNGPYAYTPPVYWYEDKKNGGAFGFNTETGPGPQVPPLESIKKMIPSEHLWPIDHYWEFHCGRNNFNTLDRYVKAMNNRYGKVNSVEEFAKVAQVINYELIRPMFEAFMVNRPKTTGIIQWMLNSAWPEMYWQLFDSYLMPNGAFYGVKKGAHPLHLVYNYGDKSIYAVNEYNKYFGDLKAEIKVLDIHSKIKWQEALTFEIEKNSTKRILPADVMEITGLNDLSDTYFISMRLLDSERREISNNFYWLSKKPDIPDYASTDWYFTPVKEYADFKELNSLPSIEIEASYHIEKTKDNERKITVSLVNPTNTIAFFIELKVAKQKSKESVLPIYWDDNYVSLLPGEQKKISATFSERNLEGEDVIFKYSGWNVKGN